MLNNFEFIKTDIVGFATQKKGVLQVTKVKAVNQ